MYKIKGGRGNFRPPFLFNLNYIKMATFKLGAIITDVAGSIGGTTIRRTPNGHAMYNKQGTQCKSAFAENSKRVQLSNVFSSWARLSEAEQTTWKKLAVLYPQKDKFGGLKQLTARQFYTKLNAQLIPVNKTVDLEDFDSAIPSAVVSSVTFDVAEEQFIFFLNESIDNVYLMVSVYRVRSKGGVKPHAHFRRTYTARITSSNIVDIWSFFANQFPFRSVGDNFGVNLQIMSKSGFLSPVQVFSVSIE